MIYLSELEVIIIRIIPSPGVDVDPGPTPKLDLVSLLFPLDVL